VLYLDPVLPDWMPDLTVRDVRIGQLSFDLRFWRDGAATLWEVLKGDPSRVRSLAFASGPALACASVADATANGAAAGRQVSRKSAIG